MPKSILITSFATWKPHQKSNTSDDLLLEILKTEDQSRLYSFRQLPVNLPVAMSIAIAKIQQFQPEIILCCGMAESRSKLSVESSAVVNQQTLQTAIDLEALTAGLPMTEISHNAGRFVCNSLYYFVLKHLQAQMPDRQALFVHVPILLPDNREQIVADFRVILQRLVKL